MSMISFLLNVYSFLLSHAAYQVQNELYLSVSIVNGMFLDVTSSIFDYIMHVTMYSLALMQVYHIHCPLCVPI